MRKKNRTGKAEEIADMRKYMTALCLCLLCLSLYAVSQAGGADLVKTKTGITIVPSSEWENTYPDVYESYMANSENSEVHEYTEEHPILKTIYEGYGFAMYYGSARGHYYCVEDVQATGRPHALANCFTCKTADFTHMANEMGVDAYSMPFADALVNINESVGCYTCHANDPSHGITVTHTYLADAMGDDFSTVAAANLSCGQCHVEYYFDPDTKATTLPYQNLAATSPDAIYDYYESIGFSDYTNPRTGVMMLKAQHPEFETFLGEGSVHAGMFTCADCHMARVNKEDGTTYLSHKWVSPLESQEIMEKCVACHQDLPGFVHGIQEKMTAREEEIGSKLELLTNKLADAVASGTYPEEELAIIRALNRKGQWYWDFVFVENAEGAHNSKLDNKCLDKANAFIEAALMRFPD
jgi:nitrite reductase (cytochrome c-552)